MKYLLIIICTILQIQLNAQEDLQPTLDSIVAEGKMLYKPEMASWILNN